MYMPHFIDLFICPGTWVASIFWLLFNNAAINIGIKIAVQVPAFNIFGYIVRSGIAGSYGNFMFNNIEELPYLIPQ